MREYFKTLIEHMAQRFAKLAIDRALEICDEVERDAQMTHRKLPELIERPMLRQLDLWIQ